MCMNHIIPVATRYQSALIDNVHKVQEVFPAETAARLNAKNLELIEKISEHTSFIAENADRLVENRKVANRIENVREKAIAYHDTVLPCWKAYATTWTNSNSSWTTRCGRFPENTRETVCFIR